MTANRAQVSAVELKLYLIAGPDAAPAGSVSLRGGEALVGRAVAKQFGNFPKPFQGKVGYYAPRLCPRA